MISIWLYTESVDNTTRNFYLGNDVVIIADGDIVIATDPETGETAEKEVVEVYVNESSELVHLNINGEEITTTPAHPFYVPEKGWTSAIDLRAGDILVLVNGEYVTVEAVQHEILESPVTVYNFQVADFHTYYVGEQSVLVHNMGDEKGCGIVSEGNSESEELIHVYRGTDKYSEIEAFNETGQLMSDATRNLYFETGDLDIAYAQSSSVHDDWIEICGNQNDYVQAHGAFGTELSQAFSLDRTLMSVTTDPDVANRFARPNGRVFEAYIPKSELIEQTLEGAGESEYLIKFGSGGFK